MTKLIILGLVVLLIFFYVRAKFRRVFSVYDRVRQQQKAPEQDREETRTRETPIDASQIEDAEFRDIR